MHYDLGIIGAGPAGSTLAILAARAGMRVLLIERTCFDAERVGETAPPEFRHLLTTLGLSQVLDATTSADAPSIVSVWGSDSPAEREHLFSPFGAGLHLDRRAFDFALARSAVAAGAVLRQGEAVKFDLRGDEIASLRLGSGEPVEAPFVVLSFGRSSRPNGMAYGRKFLNDHVGVSAAIELARSNTQSSTIVEAVPGGWFYAARLPRDRMMVMFMTSAPLVPADRSDRLRWWRKALERTSAVRAALAGAALPAILSVHDARSSIATAPIGSNFISIGDARVAPDPLSGQGLHWAVDDARCVGDSLLTAGGWKDVAIQLHERGQSDLAFLTRSAREVYAREQRFRGDPFWEGVTKTIQRTEAAIGPPMPQRCSMISSQQIDLTS